MKKKKNTRSNTVNSELEKQRIASIGKHHVLSFKRIFSDEEIQQLRDLLDSEHQQAHIGQIATGKELNNDIRRSKVRFVPEQEYKWVYDRLWRAAKELNKLYRFNLTGIKETIQLARYDEDEQGFYCWHKDTSVAWMSRKISISVPLSSTLEFEGGDLQFMLGNGGEPMTVNQIKGHAICFPSYEQHRVTPVTKGRRYSLVAWIGGPDWA